MLMLRQLPYTLRKGSRMLHTYTSDVATELLSPDPLLQETGCSPLGRREHALSALPGTLCDHVHYDLLRVKICIEP